MNSFAIQSILFIFSKPIEFDGFKKNAGFIRMGLFQSDRLVRLNQIAIRQIKTLTDKDTAKKLDFKPESESHSKRQEAKKSRENKGGGE